MSRYPDSILHQEDALRLAARATGKERVTVEVGDQSFELAAAALGDGGFWFVHDGRREKAYAAPVDGGLQVRVGGETYWFASGERDRDGASADASDPSIITAPMTGTIVKILCSAGDEVEADDDLLVLSAMKMEHKLRASAKARVASVEVEAGATVDAGALLIRLEIE